MSPIGITNNIEGYICICGCSLGMCVFDLGFSSRCVVVYNIYCHVGSIGWYIYLRCTQVVLLWPMAACLCPSYGVSSGWTTLSCVLQAHATIHGVSTAWTPLLLVCCCTSRRRSGPGSGCCSCRSWRETVSCFSFLALIYNRATNLMAFVYYISDGLIPIWFSRRPPVAEGPSSSPYLDPCNSTDLAPPSLSHSSPCCFVWSR